MLKFSDPNFIDIESHVLTSFQKSQNNHRIFLSVSYYFCQTVYVPAIWKINEPHQKLYFKIKILFRNLLSQPFDSQKFIDVQNVWNVSINCISWEVESCVILEKYNDVRFVTIHCSLLVSFFTSSFSFIVKSYIYTCARRKKFLQFKFTTTCLYFKTLVCLPSIITGWLECKLIWWNPGKILNFWKKKITIKSKTLWKL